jgi:hypothetical protein
MSWTPILIQLGVAIVAVLGGFIAYHWSKARAFEREMRKHGYWEAYLLEKRRKGN